MDRVRVLIDGLVLKQAVRDVASTKPDLSDQALIYFHSQDFFNLCSRNEIDGEGICLSVRKLIDFPNMSRKKIASQIVKVIDKSFAGGELNTSL
tara:strand:+ start:5644 stop:5925 length:282 start_codon:yes stop_codon:yes gene_type:complete